MKREIVCLCGSTRFRPRFDIVTEEETLAGNIVLSCGVWKESRPLTEEEKSGLDALHLCKIDMADRVVFVTENNYFGESTRRELIYCEKTVKPYTVRNFEAPIRTERGGV